MKRTIWLGFVVFLTVAFLSGCFYAPTVKLIPGRSEPWEKALAYDKAKAEQKISDEELNDLPSSKLKFEIFSFYIPPPTIFKTRTGSRHYYNFFATAEFAKATAAYLAGQWEEALYQCDAILSSKDKKSSELLWQTSYLRVNALVMLKRYDQAETETARMEKFEMMAMGKHANQTSRAMRAEVRYWAGDTDGAIREAGSVIKAFGEWRFPTYYSFPPIDQVELARCATAQVRANIILGLALIERGQLEKALPWLELASQTMNNVAFVARHPTYGRYFWPTEEVFYGRGFSLAALGAVLSALYKEPERVAESFEHAQEYFDAIEYQPGKDLINVLKVKASKKGG